MRYKFLFATLLVSTAVLLFTPQISSAASVPKITCSNASYTSRGKHGGSLTMIANWCYSNGKIVSSKESVTTTVSPKHYHQPIAVYKSTAKNGSSVSADANLNYTYCVDGGICNGNEIIAIQGTFYATGKYSFTNYNGG